MALVNGNTVKVKISITDDSGSGIELAPMDGLVRVINGNLKKCPSCRPSNRLELKLDCRVRFVSNWKLSYMKSELNNLYHLKRQLKKCMNHRDSRRVRKKIYSNKVSIKERKEGKKGQYITAPVVNGIDNTGRQRKVDGNKETMNSILLSFYVGTR